MGQTAPNPVLSTIKYFREEYEAHIYEKRCPAVACSALFRAPCQHACPAGMDVPSYVALVRENRLEDAYKVLLRSNPFPSVCGRVCDHPCEMKCRRSTLDEPVNIKYLKRFITDNATRPKPKKPTISRLEKIAVIGAGPSGLTAARDLAQRGYHVTVFEELPEPGGMLRYGIPAYRLPRDTLRDEINAILSLGVELRCNTRIGRERSWERITEEFDAVYVAVGAHRSARMDVDGENREGVVGAVEFLREVNLGHETNIGKKVAVVGGGNSAIDAARTAKRMKADEVTILYRRLRDDMPAQDEEIHAAVEEGVNIQYLVTPVRITGENGRVSQVVCQRMSLGEFDSSGRRKPLPIAGAEFVLDVDQVICAIGQRPELRFLDRGEDGDVRVTKNGLIATPEKKSTRTGKAMIFAGGDAVTGPSTVVWAVSAGHRAAAEIDTAIRTKNGEPPYVEEEIEIEIPAVLDEEIKESRRAGMPELPAESRVTDFREVETGLSPDVALVEARRCLRCDVQIG